VRRVGHRAVSESWMLLLFSRAQNDVCLYSSCADVAISERVAEKEQRVRSVLLSEARRVSGTKLPDSYPVSQLQQSLNLTATRYNTNPLEGQKLHEQYGYQVYTAGRFSDLTLPSTRTLHGRKLAIRVRRCRQVQGQ